MPTKTKQPAAGIEAEAQAYSGLLDAISELGPEGARLATAIDRLVGARLVQVEDEAILRALRTRELVLRDEYDDELFNFPVTAAEGDGDESRYDTATPAGRYLALADRIAGLGPEAERLVNRLHSAVHERLDEAKGGEVTATVAVEVIALRRDLEELRRQLASEVRTRRLVVVDETGYERIDASALSASAELRLRSKEDPETGVALFVSDENIGACAGVVLYGDDTEVARLEVEQMGELVDAAATDDDAQFLPGSVTHEARLHLHDVTIEP